MGFFRLVRLRNELCDMHLVLLNLYFEAIQGSLSLQRVSLAIGHVGPPIRTSMEKSGRECEVTKQTPMMINCSLTMQWSVSRCYRMFGSAAQPSPKTGMPGDSSDSVSEWERLEEHFRQHASIVTYFRNANAAAVLQMLKSGVNDVGAYLSQFERDALIERHCELFGRWPE
jgi:hypothetical protein